MAKRKGRSTVKRLRMYKFDIGHKFESIEEANKVVENLVGFMNYQCKERKYFCQAVIGISELDAENTIGIKTEITNKRGRPKTLPVFTSTEFNDWESGVLDHVEPREIKVKPHIHMLILCCPGESFAKRIRKYLLGVLAPLDAEGNETSVYKKPSNIDHAMYIFKQSSIRYTPNYNYSPMYQDFPEEMTMGNLFTSYRRLSDMKLNTDKQLPTYKKQKKTHYEFLAIRNFYATIVPYKTTKKDLVPEYKVIKPLKRQYNKPFKQRKY
ncbi:hypothetical protein G7061_09280 [Erysipelothrix sp. HDW6B]|uniref:hypothetical protein n=1 Tax=Erysipelothrix sp. HDW6B TaxID=2714929 RepID=UPI00140C9EED|nr:hypothetical protein [Erysipelothrix sp. HDW6B]QIK86792.1 hypothetical protein G7061_09280 [Erysipelothrix sp. HDW6B]